VDLPAGHRYPSRTEAAVYFCCVEALRAGGGPLAVELRGSAAEVVLRITGSHDGIDLLGVADRVEAVGGHLTSDPGRLLLTVPVVGPEREVASVLAGDPGDAVPLG
jgi:hypothetical protein